MNVDQIHGKNVFRINQLQHAYTRANDLNSIAPKLLEILMNVEENTVTVVTHLFRNETIVDFSTQSQPRTIALLAKICALIAFLHESGIAHGYIHENSIYHSQLDNAYVLRGFDPDLDTFTPKYDITCLRSMIGRIALRCGFDASKAIAQLTTCGPSRACETFMDMLSESDGLVSRCVVDHNVARRANINTNFNIYFVEDMTNMDTITDAVTHAFLNHWNKGIVPMFALTKSKGVGWGPTTEIINAFLDRMYSSGKLIYDSGYTASHTAINGGLDINKLIGYVLMYAIYFNLPINIPPPPRSMIMFLLSSKEELIGMRDSMSLGDSKKNCVLINMWTGARLIVSLLRNEGWTASNLCQYVITHWEKNYDNQTLQAHQFDIDDSFTNDQKALFLEWATKYASTQTLRGFVKTLTGSQTLDKYAIYHVRWDDDPKKIDFYQWHISSCSKQLSLYRNSVNLEHFKSVVGIDALMRAIIEDSSRNVYNDQ